MPRLHNKKELISFRKQLRNNATQAEKLLWYELRKSQLIGKKFRRQHGIGKYILDFYCPEARLAIELDGSQHEEDNQQEHDEIRTKFLNGLRISVIRFKNTDVIYGRDAVAKRIHEKMRQLEKNNPLKTLSDFPVRREPLLLHF